ncbi:MAG: hypothetical protein M3O46_04325, partial [Myxococcota bacterium]|nr:hypothetical protein [Myxococcota bacterium]
ELRRGNEEVRLAVCPDRLEQWLRGPRALHGVRCDGDMRGCAEYVSMRARVDGHDLRSGPMRAHEE